MATRATPGRRRGVPAAHQARWTRTYAETPFHELPWFSARPSPWIVEVARGRWWPRGGRILDVGCGAGTNSLYLARRGYAVDGVDLAPGAVDAARARAAKERRNVAFHVADALNLPFPDGHFVGALDIGCFHTIPIRLRRAYARELARVVAPRGVHALSWIPRESSGAPGPPHRPSVEEVARALEEEFVFLRTEYAPAFWTAEGRRPVVHALLGRRGAPRPPRR